MTIANKTIIEKVGVMWSKTFKNKKNGHKISLDGNIYIAYENLKKKNKTDPDHVIVKFIDIHSKK